MQLNNCEINILIKGRKATEFKSPMDFQTYIEGRDGSEFEIEFVNNNAVDVEAILSLDGLSITDGKPAGSTSSGYMVPARQRISISGWTLDKATVAKFFFAGAKGGSYAEQSGQDSRNKGVIGAKVFGRKKAAWTNTTLMSSGSVTLSGSGNSYNSVSPTFGGPLRSMTKSASLRGPSRSSNTSYTSMNCVSDAAATSLTSPGIGSTEIDQSYTAVEQTLGAGFGDATEFKTEQVTFERGDMLALFELFYDDAQGLKRRGIDVRAPARPSAFPADEPTGCSPPPGWTGAK